MTPTWIRSLSAPETRVLGCLLEKQRTTPDAYPLSLNGLRLACNQSTNRDPVVDYDEAIIRDALHRLERRGIARLAGASRAAKYRHLLAEALPMDGGEQAVICVLMLRGAQTPGELKQRTERMHPLADLGAVHGTLERLIERGLVERLDRRPGQKEERYAQLLQQEEGEGEEQPAPRSPATGLSQPDLAAPPPNGGSAASYPPIDDLHERVARLEREVAALRAAIGDSPADDTRDGVAPEARDAVAEPQP